MKLTKKLELWKDCDGFNHLPQLNGEYTLCGVASDEPTFANSTTDVVVVSAIVDCPQCEELLSYYKKV